MSQELVGNCGAIVGSGEYFQRINHGAIFAPFLSGYQYSSAIGQLCSRCVSVMEEIYSDMRNAPTTVFALPEDQKENLRKTIANLDEAASFLFPAYTCATACRTMLEIDKPESDSGIGSIWGQDIGSSSYIQSKCSPIYQSILADSFSNIRLTIISDLANIAQQIATDIDYGLDANHYMKEENGAAIQGAIDELERCNCMALSSHRSKAGRLCWYQDVPKDQVRALQKALNKIPEFGTLTEDGVYGEKTSSSLEQILDGLTHGAFPSLTYINPLQTSMTGIEATLKTTKSGMQFSQIVQVGSNMPLLRADLHRFGKNPQYYHINVKAPTDATAMQKSIASQFDHMEISPEAYNLLKNFDDTAKVVKIGGKVLLVAAAVMDAIEIAEAIHTDLNDADQKLGKTTARASLSVVGSWGGGMAGAKLGAAAGAGIGTAILPGLGTAVGGIVGGLVLGVAGSMGMSALAEYVVDITDIWE